MATWNSRGLRGSGLEEVINLTNEKYRSSGLGLIQKIPTPIKPINIDKDNRHITLAYFEQRSTVDFIGAIQGYPICFDAKECQSASFPIRNVHEHQILFMEDFEKQGGVAFLIIFFAQDQTYYYMRFRELSGFWNRAKLGHEKSIKRIELDPSFVIPSNGYYVHYLELIKKDILLRGED